MDERLAPFSYFSLLPRPSPIPFSIHERIEGIEKDVLRKRDGERGRARKRRRVHGESPEGERYTGTEVGKKSGKGSRAEGRPHSSCFLSRKVSPLYSPETGGGRGGGKRDQSVFSRWRERPFLPLSPPHCEKWSRWRKMPPPPSTTPSRTSSSS